MYFAQYYVIKYCCVIVLTRNTQFHQYVLNQENYSNQEIKWSFTRFKVFCCPRDFLIFCPFQTEWEQLKKAKGNQLNCRFHFSVSPFFSTRLLWGKTTRFLPKTETINNFVAKKNEKKKKIDDIGALKHMHEGEM